MLSYKMEYCSHFKNIDKSTGQNDCLKFAEDFYLILFCLGAEYMREKLGLGELVVGTREIGFHKADQEYKALVQARTR